MFLFKALRNPILNNSGTFFKFVKVECLTEKCHSYMYIWNKKAVTTVPTVPQSKMLAKPSNNDFWIWNFLV